MARAPNASRDASRARAAAVNDGTRPPGLAAMKADFLRLASPGKARASAWFFRTGPGGYGEGDRFLGLTVPQQRALASKYRALPLDDVLALLGSPWHEHRLTALIMLGQRFERADRPTRAAIARHYLAQRSAVNNWDLVDSSAPHVLGPYLLDRSRAVLDRLARSRSVWDRRIAIIATSAFIRSGQYEDTLRLATVLLDDTHDLIHKATGWMLREVGNRDRARLLAFLDRHGNRMPRTMLRYAVERLPADLRRHYVHGTGRRRRPAVRN